MQTPLQCKRKSLWIAGYEAACTSAIWGTSFLHPQYGKLVFCMQTPRQRTRQEYVVNIQKQVFCSQLVFALGKGTWGSKALIRYTPSELIRLGPKPILAIYTGPFPSHLSFIKHLPSQQRYQVDCLAQHLYLSSNRKT